jgi:hypothetical protein
MHKKICEGGVVPAEQSCLKVHRAAIDSRLPRSPSVEDLVAPYSIDALLSEHSNTSAFLVFRDQDQEFAEVLCLEELDRLVSYKIFDGTDLKIVRDGVVIDLLRHGKREVAVRSALDSALRDGAVLCFGNIDRHHFGLARQKAFWQNEVRTPLSMHAFLSAKGGGTAEAACLLNHSLILQIEGSARHSIRCSGDALVSPDAMCVEAAPGSVLFLRRGLFHSSITESDYSISLIVEFGCVSQAEVVLKAFQRASLDDPILRRSITVFDLTDQEKIDEARQLILKAVKAMDLERARHDLQQALLREQIGYVSKPLVSIFGDPVVGDADIFCLRPGVLQAVNRQRDTVEITIDGSLYSLPVAYGAAIEFVVRHKEFQFDSLPISVRAERLKFCRRLMEIGLIECRAS